MNTAIAFKVQLGDKIKMLASNDYNKIEDLTQAAKSSYPKRLANKEISLKYADEDGDWLYLSDDNDLEVLKTHASELKGKKVKLVIDVTENNRKSQKDRREPVEEIKNALEKTSLEDKSEKDEEMKEETKFEDLKDFKFNDVATELEALLNCEEKVRPRQIMQAFRKATLGTKAEVHVKRFLKKNRKHHGGPRHGFKKMMKQCLANRSTSRDNSSSPEDHCPPFFGPMGDCAQMPQFAGCGPMGHPFAQYGPHMGPHGGFGPRGHRGGHKHAMKFFKKFMKAYRSSSSSSSSEERKQKRQHKRAENVQKRQEMKQKRPFVTQKPEDVITGKANETVNVTISVENGSPWPLWLTGVQKISGDDSVKFETITLDKRLFKDENNLDIELAITLPSEEGDYSATFGFLNKKGIQTGEELTLPIKVVQ